MSPYRRNIMVGVTVLGAVLILGWMILKFSSKTAELFAPPQIALQIHASRADGLSPGSAVQFLGVEVGRVTALSRDSDARGVTIEALVDRIPPLPANVRAAIVQNNLLGGASLLSLDVDGDLPQGQLAANTHLNAKYVGLTIIPPALTQTADQIGAMSEEFRKTARELRESGTIEDLDAAVKNINIQASKAGKLLDSFQEITGDPATQEGLKTAIANIKNTTASAAKIADKIDALTGSLKDNSDNINLTLKDTQQHIDDLSKQLGDRLTQVAVLLSNVQSITGKIDKGQGTAGQFVNDPRLYQALVESSRELNATVTDLKRLVEQWEQEGVSLKLK